MMQVLAAFLFTSLLAVIFGIAEDDLRDKIKILKVIER
jgi:hypothetical protein